MKQKIGIYLIENKVNGRCYIGKSVNLESRINSHFLDMRSSRSNRKMQKDYDKYGEEAFESKILEIVGSEKDLLEREAFYINKFNSIKTGYNSKTAKPEGYNGVSTGLNDIQYELVLEESKKEGLSVSAWLKNIILERID